MVVPRQTVTTQQTQVSRDPVVEAFFGLEGSAWASLRGSLGGDGDAASAARATGARGEPDAAAKAFGRAAAPDGAAAAVDPVARACDDIALFKTVRREDRTRLYESMYALDYAPGACVVRAGEDVRLEPELALEPDDRLVLHGSAAALERAPEHASHRCRCTGLQSLHPRGGDAV